MFKNDNFGDMTPDDMHEYWTVALVENDHSRQEVHFGVFPQSQARAAMESGRVTTFPGQHLELRRIRAFPSGA